MISIVGAGPGSQELLTLGAYDRLQKAEIVLYDALVSNEILSLIPENIKLESVGKRFRKHSFTQEQIGEALVSKNKEYKKIVRLKGGDTSIFARLSEEIKILVKKEIPFEIIPGVTTCSGVAGALNTSLTNRDYGPDFIITTARSYEDPEYCQLIASFLKRESGVGIYMPIHQGDLVIKNLKKTIGKKISLPLIIVVNATLEKQRVLKTLLYDANWEEIREFSSKEPTFVLMGYPYKDLLI